MVSVKRFARFAHANRSLRRRCTLATAFAIHRLAGVLLTSADIDQVAGLLSLRELQPFRIYCTPALRRILREDNSAFGMLNRVPQQVCWTEISLGESFPLLDHGGR